MSKKPLNGDKNVLMEITLTPESYKSFSLRGRMGIFFLRFLGIATLNIEEEL